MAQRITATLPAAVKPNASATEKAGQSDVWQNGYVNADNLREWEKAGAFHEGVDIFNTVKHRIEETAHASFG